MHETYETSIEVVKLLLPELYARGYQVVNVSTLSNIHNKELLKHHVYNKGN